MKIIFWSRTNNIFYTGSFFSCYFSMVFGRCGLFIKFYFLYFLYFYTIYIFIQPHIVESHWKYAFGPKEWHPTGLTLRLEVYFINFLVSFVFRNLKEGDLRIKKNMNLHSKEVFLRLQRNQPKSSWICKKVDLRFTPPYLTCFLLSKLIGFLSPLKQ